ncbi:cytochrome C [Virgibacillus dakarensis]|uniref:Cytochrome c oxidase subunit I n=1 Tax=Lentibacillus populi TaxID=1827502 RepID=A0A9W5X546_9BACI|nr:MULTISPECIES: cbb3-type cytochrome c oxidase subunit I [Bacillaceae]MBT2215361.1 cbb3-type cytochrome c oxidase subunit I [Virgibacillus dakarensis]MTW85469.1 cytochrome C [Virgibacillus dakarensis]GGB39567.1 cytochrome c oxidase subunit I [Lentibacillus populi]
MEQAIQSTLREKANRALGVNLKDAKLSKAYLSVSFITLLVGGILGLLQGLERSGLLELPAWLNYYQVLTAHGILLILIFTSTFTIGYLYAGVSHTLGGLLPKVRKMAWTGFVLMLIGVALVVITIVANEASVLYTFYPPLAASPVFYIGLVFVVLGIWSCCFGVFINYNHWRKNHRGEVTPLLAFFAMGVFVLWFFGSLGVTTEVLTLIPWSLGWKETINVMVSRTLFWSFGHTLVNIWYIVATSAWYVVVPKIIGGRVFSDKLARLVVVLLVILNIPGGFHHQIIDPGISESVKFLHVFMSISIAFPSLMTAFAMFAVFERAGRKLGGKGLLGWFKKLPWGDVRFLAPMVAMIAFIPAGAGGIVNTSNQMNQVIHNTLWVVGHFHLTVGTSVVLTFFGICYWLIPYLAKRKLTPQMNKLGVIQTIIWTVGMILMSGSQHLVGLLGDPRRTAFTTYGDHNTALSWVPYEYVMGIGATLLLIGVIIQVYAVFNMMFFAPKGETEFPIGEPEDDALPTPIWMERWGLWIVLMLMVVAMAYVVPVVDFIVNAPPGSPPIKTW